MNRHVMTTEPLHVSVLRALGLRLQTRRERHLEEMAKGLKLETYNQVCGRAAECKALIEEIDQMLTSIRKDELELDRES